MKRNAKGKSISQLKQALAQQKSQLTPSKTVQLRGGGSPWVDHLPNP